jgi:hypothetical protein
VGESPRGLLTNTEQGHPVSTDQHSTDGSGALTTTSRIVEIMPAAQHGLVSGHLGSFFHESAEPCSIRMRQRKGGKGQGWPLVPEILILTKILTNTNEY